MKTVDTRGRLCPEPLIITRKAIAKGEIGDTFEIISNNATSKDNLIGFLTEMGVVPKCEERGGEYFLSFTLSKSFADVKIQSSKVEDFCCSTPPKSSAYAVAIRSEFMGGGDDKLGALLMRAFFNSLSELKSLPANIVIYNSGVKLVVDGSDSASALAVLKDRGVRIIACGTCVDFFDLKGATAVAEIGNMLLISDILSGSSNIVYP